MNARIARLLAVSAILVAARVGSAAPTVGHARPAVRLVDAWDRELAVPARVGKPLLLVYEDKDSANQNADLKAELATLARRPEHREKAIVIAVADVSSYDYFPAKGFVKSAIKEQSAAIGAPIYCDWNGGLRARLGLDEKRSNVVLYDVDGRVVFSHAGQLSRDERARLVALLRRLSG